jgi:molybdopterin/thiamine biosynthesis adenylyltransferase
MMDWALKNPRRLLEERARIEELAKEEWIKAVVWRLTSELAVEADVDMQIHGAVYAVTLIYTDLFPETAAYVRPRDHSQHWSGHQYGPGGTLCLEWREDNWHSGVTGADLLRSAHKLLSTERNPDEPDHVASAHRLTEGQVLRGSDDHRLVLTAAAATWLSAMASPGSLRLRTAMVFHNGPNVVFISEIEGPDGSLSAVPDLPAGLTAYGFLFTLPQEGHAFKHESLGASEVIESLASLEDKLRNAGFSQELVAACKTAPSKYRHHVVVLVGKDEITVFGVPGGESPSLLKYALIMPHDITVRLPAEHARLAASRIGIVGLGSLGSKVALSLARSGVRRFQLVDDDVLLPENICRHELSWAAVGLHKVQALQEDLSLIAPNMEVAIHIHRVGGQESAMHAARVVKELGACDLLIDATADPAVFLRLAAAARANCKPMCWGEVFAGGFGGLVARARPEMDPHPGSVRNAILNHSGVLPAAPFRNAQGYDGDDRQPLVAFDCDVAQVAAALTRFALDILLKREKSDFPYSAYLIGMRKEWCFEEPFDTRPINVSGDGWNAAEGDGATETERAEAVKVLLSMAGQRADAKPNPSS